MITVILPTVWHRPGWSSDGTYFNRCKSLRECRKLKGAMLTGRLGLSDFPFDSFLVILVGGRRCRSHGKYQLSTVVTVQEPFTVLLARVLIRMDVTPNTNGENWMDWAGFCRSILWINQLAH